MRNIFAFTTFLVFVVLTANATRVHAEVRTQRIVSGLDQPLFVTSDPDDADRLFIVEKGGLIKVFDQSTGSLLDTPFLDLSSQVSTVGEQGLLGLAFHPDYINNGQFYVNYTDTSGNLQVSQYNVSADPNVANMVMSQSVINIPQSSAIHNGGWIGFDPTAPIANPYLYIAVGDDHIGYKEIEVGDPPTTEVTLQNRESLNGAILRIDVDGSDVMDGTNHYGIPTNNPFAGNTDGEKQEIWAYGLRNPWRPSFDSTTGDLYIADVGENTREEINFQLADVMGNQGGNNYGWPHREGTTANPDAVDGAEPDGNVNPLTNYAHGDGQFEGGSVTGGYVYRGSDVSTQGNYFYSDFVTGRIYSIEVNGVTETLVPNSRTDWTDLIAPLNGSIDSVSSFGEDAAGNLFIVDFDGEIYRIDPVDEMATTAAYVDGLYSAALGRDGESSGRGYWIGQLTGDGMTDPAMTRDEVATAFWESVENVGQRVDRLYNDFLQRPADASGRANLVAEIRNNGKSDIDIAVAMLTSFEFHRDHLSDLEFIDAVYRRALGRAPTSVEFSARFLEMQAGDDRETVAQLVLESVDRILIDVQENYDSLLGRPGDSGGVIHFGQAILGGTMDASDVAAAMLASQEFVYGALRDANFGDDMVVASSASSQSFALAALETVPVASQANQTAAAAVPEPTSWALCSFGLACLAARARRRRR